MENIIRTSYLLNLALAHTCHCPAIISIITISIITIIIITIIIIIAIIILIIIIITRLSPAFGRLGLGGSSGGQSSCE